MIQKLWKVECGILQLKNGTNSRAAKFCQITSGDIKSRAHFDNIRQAMEDQTLNKGKQRHCKTFCVPGGPNKRTCTNSGDTPGISMHCFPTDPAVRQQWVTFVRRHRVDFNPVEYSSRIYLCSAHFELNCFSKRFATTLEKFNNTGTKHFLSRGSIPTIDVQPVSNNTNEIAVKERRVVSIYNIFFMNIMLLNFWGNNQVLINLCKVEQLHYLAYICKFLLLKL
jgi:hypothetical protein